MARANVRVALQSGATALSSLFWSSLGFAFVAAGLGAFFSLKVGPFGLLFVAIGGLVMVLTLREARRRRASDLVIGADGLVIDGGSRSGAAFSWNDLTRARIHEDRSESITTTTTLGKTVEYLNSLVFVQRSNVEDIVAQSLDKAEKQSLADIASAVNAALFARSRPAPARRTLPNVLSCPKCGSPVTPADAPSVACHFCGAMTAIPPDLRQNIQRAAQNVTHDALITQLLNQPGAATTNNRLGAFAAIYFLAPLGLLGPQAFPIAGAAMLTAWGVVSRSIADRLTVRALVLDFAARTPDAAGHPYGCRRCGAPLPPAAEGRAIVTCVYCAAENVIGLDAFAHERDPSASDDGLEAALAARTRAQRRATLKIAGGIAGAIVACGALLRHLLG